MGDEGVGRLENGAGGAVVLFQPHHLGVGVVALETLHVLHLGPTPAIDGLVVVPHQEKVVPLPGQQPQPGVLDGVGVLKLVHQDVGEALLVVVADVGSVAQQLVGAQQELGEIDLAATGAGGLVLVIDLDQLALEEVTAVVQMLRSSALVLLGVDEARDLAGRVAGLVELHLLEQALDQALLVLGVEDLEVLGQAGVLPVGAQKAMSQAMEGADPHAADRLLQDLLDATAHLPRRLIGEGDGQQGPGDGPLHLDEPGDAMHQHPGLAAAGPGQHQAVAAASGDGLALGVVEGGEDGGDVFHGRHFSPLARSGRGELRSSVVGGAPIGDSAESADLTNNLSLSPSWN